MFEGETKITFSKDAAKLMMSRNVTSMFGMPLEVSSMEYGYKGLEITFAAPGENAPEKPQRALTPLPAEPEQPSEEL